MIVFWLEDGSWSEMQKQEIVDAGLQKAHKLSMFSRNDVWPADEL